MVVVAGDLLEDAIGGFPDAPDAGSAELVPGHVLHPQLVRPRMQFKPLKAFSLPVLVEQVVVQWLELEIASSDQALLEENRDQMEFVMLDLRRHPLGDLLRTIFAKAFAFPHVEPDSLRLPALLPGFGRFVSVRERANDVFVLLLLDVGLGGRCRLDTCVDLVGLLHCSGRGLINDKVLMSATLSFDPSFIQLIIQSSHHQS